MNYKLTLMYDGTKYAGWQKQPHAKTVQGELEKAICVIAREEANVTGVSRTDAGVHAKEYVCNVHLSGEPEIHSFQRGLNALLPDDIKVKQIETCSEEFNARFDVISKTYVYTIDNSEYGNVFTMPYCWHYRFPLDVEKMKATAKYFIGEHDFSAFMSSGSSAKDFVRTIYDCRVTKHEEWIEIEICGNGFLYNMVRIIAGTLLMIGCDKIKVDDIADIIASRDRKKAGMTAPPQGLKLESVQY